MRNPLLSMRAGTVSHVFCRNGPLVDRYSTVNWVENGTVPRVQHPQWPVWGFGPFADNAYISLGSGADALDFAGDFSACFIFTQPTNLSVAPYIFDDGNTPNLGYAVDLDTTGKFTFFDYADNVGPASGNVTVAGVNVGCIGNAGTTSLAKLNLGTIASRTLTTWTPASGVQARLGRGSVIAARPFGGTLYEAWFSTMTPSDALFTDMMKEVKYRLGITAW